MSKNIEDYIELVEEYNDALEDFYRAKMLVAKSRFMVLNNPDAEDFVVEIERLRRKTSKARTEATDIALVAVKSIFGND